MSPQNQEIRSPDGAVSSRLPALPMSTVVVGASAGVASFVVGYLLTFVTATGTVQRVARGFQTLSEAGVALAPEWKVAAWTFLDANLVGTSLGSERVNLVRIAGVEYLYVVAVLLLVVAGAATAYYHGSRDLREAATAGTTVVFGYFLFGVLAWLFTGYANVGPAPLRLIVFAGILYPVVFGAIGGALTSVVRRDRPA